jgi:uncharacterized protein YjbI with pentapeptide repeats
MDPADQLLELLSPIKVPDGNEHKRAAFDVEGWNALREKRPDYVPDLSGMREDIGVGVGVLKIGMRDMQGINLSGMDLRLAFVNGADLRHADLRGADLRGLMAYPAQEEDGSLVRTDLRSVDLSGADLSGARLTGADMRGANLSEANLQGAQLMHADLSGVNLTNADLSGADLSQSVLGVTKLCEADLEGVNLERAHLIGTNLTRIRNWRSIVSVTGAELSHIKDAPEGFVAWAVENGAILETQTTTRKKDHPRGFLSVLRNKLFGEPD